MQIDVIYIARGIDWGIKTVKKFIESFTIIALSITVGIPNCNYRNI